MKKIFSLLIVLCLTTVNGVLMAQNFALHFDGANDKIGVLDNAVLNPTEALTIEVWMNADVWAGSIWGACLLSKQGTGPDKGFGLTVGENGRVEFTHSVDQSWVAVNTPQILGLNTWYHIAGVYDGSSMKLYVNGILQSQVDVSGTFTPGTGVVMNFGDNPTWSGRRFTGTMDEIRIWNVARTDAEIQQNMTVELTGSEAGLVGYWNMNEGAGTTIADISGNGNTGTLLNMDATAWVGGFTPPGNDVGVLGIAAPSVIGSGFTNEEVIKIDVKNFSTQEVTGFDVSYQINDGEIVTETFQDVLPPFTSAIYIFSTPVDLSGQNEVAITGSVHLEGDGSPENDAITETISQTNNFMLFDHEQHNYGSSGQVHTKFLYMPDDLTGYSQILLHADLECPAGGCDPWDQPALLNILKDGYANEIVRYITPFGVACGGWVWDITDFKPLMSGKTTFESIIQAWGASGWLLNMELEFIPGTPDYPYVSVDRLWNETNWVYGDPNISYDLPEKTITINPETDAAKIRMTISGHGQGNTLNAAEFAEFTHKIWVNGSEAFPLHLWKTDCGQNACSPQNGTYLYSRAGWCPGQDIQPWEFDLDGMFTPGSDLNLDLVLAEYLNLLNTGYNGSSHTEPYFKIQAYLIQYSTDMFVGVNDQKISTPNGYFEVFPNPSSGVFTISANHTEIESVRILTMNGRIIDTRSFAGQQRFDLNLESQPDGLYILQVTTKEGVSAVKISKQ